MINCVKVKEKRNNQFFSRNCIYIPENYPEDWRERLEAGEVVSCEEDGEQCEIWLDMEEAEEAANEYDGDGESYIML